MRKSSITIFAVLHVAAWFIAAAVSKPIRPEPKTAEPKAPAVQSLAMESNWGTVSQDGQVIRIDGHPQWTATGTIRADGSILVFWTFTVDGRIAPGVYHVKDGELVGVWGYGCTVEPDGTLAGPTSPDRIYKIMPPDPVTQ